MRRLADLARLAAAEVCKIGVIREDADERMGIEALYRRPRTATPEPGYKIYPYLLQMYPYLLRGMEISRPNQVLVLDITYIRMARPLRPRLSLTIGANHLQCCARVLQNQWR